MRTLNPSPLVRVFIDIINLAPVLKAPVDGGFTYGLSAPLSGQVSRRVARALNYTHLEMNLPFGHILAAQVRRVVWLRIPLKCEKRPAGAR